METEFYQSTRLFWIANRRPVVRGKLACSGVFQDIFRPEEIQLKYTHTETHLFSPYLQLNQAKPPLLGQL